jgi:GxxExxY protein
VQVDLLVSILWAAVRGVQGDLIPRRQDAPCMFPVAFERRERGFFRMLRRQPDKETELIEKELTRQIIGAFFACWNELGYGFLESVYRRALVIELRSRGLGAIEEAPVGVLYRTFAVGSFKLDLLVEGRVIVEAKATAALGPTDKRQLINYLRATGLEVGLLLHFGPQPRFERCINAKQVYSTRQRHNSRNPAVSVQSD